MNPDQLAADMENDWLHKALERASGTDPKHPGVIILSFISLFQIPAKHHTSANWQNFDPFCRWLTMVDSVKSTTALLYWHFLRTLFGPDFAKYPITPEPRPRRTGWIQDRLGIGKSDVHCQPTSKRINRRPNDILPVQNLRQSGIFQRPMPGYLWKNSRCSRSPARNAYPCIFSGGQRRLRPLSDIDAA